MKKLLFPRETVARMSAYDPGKYEVDINLSANENPYDLPAELKLKVIEAASKPAFNRYPDPSASALRSAIAARHDLSVDNIAVGNGGDELLLSLLLAYGGRTRTAVTFEPTFVMYGILSELTQTSCARLKRQPNFALPKNVADEVKKEKGDIVFVCSPNNPSGNMADREEILALVEETHALVVVDEAYQEFSRVSMCPLLKNYPNLVILRTFSKAFSLAGLRVGYLMGSAEVIANILKVKLPYNLNVFSQIAARVLIENQAHFTKVIDEIVAQRQRVFEAVRRTPGLTPYPSSANFILVKSEGSGTDLWRKLLSKSILVRDFSQVDGAKNCLRFTIGSPRQNDALIDALEAYSVEAGQDN